MHIHDDEQHTKHFYDFDWRQNNAYSTHRSISAMQQKKHTTHKRRQTTREDISNQRSKKLHKIITKREYKATNYNSFLFIFFFDLNFVVSLCFKNCRRAEATKGKKNGNIHSMSFRSSFWAKRKINEGDGQKIN